MKMSDDDAFPTLAVVEDEATRRSCAGLDERLAGLDRRPLPGGLTLLVAGDRRSRRHGLAHLDALSPGHALLLERCRSVHTLGMRFALDLLWLDGDGALVRLDPAVGPRRVRTCLKARAIVEAAAGDGERFAVALAAAAASAAQPPPALTGRGQPPRVPDGR
jgi:uncharacterized membrane protein (UPF0127 family)